jgi:hypothetical protein
MQLECQLTKLECPMNKNLNDEMSVVMVILTDGIEKCENLPIMLPSQEPLKPWKKLKMVFHILGS